MKPDNKLFNLLRTFTARDFRLFNDFLLSPYFNKQQVLVEYYQHLKKHAPHYEHEELSKQQLIKLFFHKQAPLSPWRWAGGEAIDDKKLRYLTTDLTRLLKNILLQNTCSMMILQLQIICCMNMQSAKTWKNTAGILMC